MIRSQDEHSCKLLCSDFFSLVDSGSAVEEYCAKTMDVHYEPGRRDKSQRFGALRKMIPLSLKRPHVLSG